MKTVSASPHIASKNSTRRIMIDVLIALCPCVIAACVFYGYHVVINLVVCLAFCFGAELLYNLIIGKKWNAEGVKNASVKDLSFAVTAVILTLNLPAVMPVSKWGMTAVGKNGSVIFSFDTVVLCALASIFAIMLVKMLFGGIGKNFVNPAAAGRVFAFMTVSLAAVQTIGLGLDASTGATWLSGHTGGVSGSVLLNMFIGNTGSAAVGETCAIAIIIGFVYLVVRKVIDFKLPLIIVGSAFVFALLMSGVRGVALGEMNSAGEVLSNALAHVLSGGLLFGSVYMATDYATSPNTPLGRIIFGVGIALITMLIRVFASAPEGMSFAILIMNIVTPLIDRYIYPKPFGYVKPEKKKKAKEEKAA